VAVATGDFWTGIASLAVAILGGGLAMAWRLGRLEQTVKDLKEDVAAVEKRVETFLLASWREQNWHGEERRKR
jgi:hypothetical protein